MLKSYTLCRMFTDNQALLCTILITGGEGFIAVFTHSVTSKKVLFVKFLPYGGA